MSELASAYVNIIPSAKGMNGKLTSILGGESASAGASAGSLLGSNLVGTLTKVVAAAGIGKIVSDAVSKGADLEQSIGGIETLFGTGGAKSVQEYADQVGKSVEEVSKEYADLTKAQETMVKYSNEAYKTAGLSANDYMQTVTSFAASLKQSVGGDMEVMTKAANQAVVDMSDNANKMGTPMESIMNAYKGFAKQNYTMLDNLSLGYGGTKSEMERLLADAEKLSGVKYDIGNLSDVYSAIHVVQEELGITGTTSKEAASTISGSLTSMKASFDNVLAKITIGEDISSDLNALVETTVTFAKNNLLPALQNIGSALPGALRTLFNSAYPIISELIGELFNKLPTIISNGFSAFAKIGSQILDSLISAVNDGSAESGASEFGETLLSIVSAAVDGIVENVTTLAPKLWELATAIISQLITAITEYAPTIGESGSTVISDFMSGLQANLPSLLEEGVSFITNVANGILQAMPVIIQSAGQMILSFVQGLLPMLPTLMESGVQLILNLIDGIVSALPSLLETAGTLVLDLMAALVENYPSILEAGFNLLGELIAGIIKAIPKIGSAIVNFRKTMIEKVKEMDWKKIGSDILDAIIKGLKSGGAKVKDAIKDLFGNLFNNNNSNDKNGSDASKAGNSIGSDFAGGIAGGIKNGSNEVGKAVRELSDLSTNYEKNLINDIGKSSTITVKRTADDKLSSLERRLDALSESLSTYSNLVASGRSVNITLQGDAKTMFKAIQRENNMYRTSTGRGAFA